MFIYSHAKMEDILQFMHCLNFRSTNIVLGNEKNPIRINGQNCLVKC